MKKVDELSVGEMQRYLDRIGRIKKTIGGAYRLFWPFRTWSPFSPVRLFLNLMVLVSWGLVVHWAIVRPSSEMDLLVQLGWVWAAAVVISFILGLIERHFRIMSRYRAMTMAQNPPFSKPPPKGVDPIYHYGKEVFRRIFR